jgi:ParB family chromosome partitioning protein
MPLGEIKPYEDAPFKVRLDENMEELVESIKENGVLVPTIARPHTNGGVEMLAGHRRLKACELAGLDKLPVIVKDLDDDAAIILLVDSNIHREDILPSEKAFAYQMKLEAMKRQGKRSDLTSRQFVGKSESADIIGKDADVSGRQIQRYIRLTNLIDPILEMVDNKQIAFNAAVELSYLGSKEQAEVYQSIEAEEVAPSIEQSRKIRRFSQDGKLNSAVIESIMQEQKPEKIKITFDEDKIKRYFPKNYSKKQIEDMIIRLLEQHRKQQMKKKNQMER